MAVNETYSKNHYTLYGVAVIFWIRSGYDYLFLVYKKTLIIFVCLI